MSPTDVAWALIVLIATGCQDLGPPRREHEPPRPQASPSDAPAAPRSGVIAVRCGRATVALSPDLRASARLAGGNSEELSDGRVTITGGVRLALAGLELVCDCLEITPCEGSDRFLLLASGDVVVRRGDATLSGNTLVIDGDSIQVAGRPRLDVAWRVDAPAR